MAHHGHSSTSSDGASRAMVIFSLILFFVMSAVGHYVFIMKDSHAETATEESVTPAAHHEKH